jgi:hypothetical protein
LQEKASPLVGRTWSTREGSGHVPRHELLGLVARGSYKDLYVTPGDVHGRRTTEVLCGGLAEDIITTACAVMMDWTGWSSPIGAARQTK